MYINGTRGLAVFGQRVTQAGGNWAPEACKPEKCSVLVVYVTKQSRHVLGGPAGSLRGAREGPRGASGGPRKSPRGSQGRPQESVVGCVKPAKVPLLSTMDAYERSQLADALKTQS